MTDDLKKDLRSIQDVYMVFRAYWRVAILVMNDKQEDE